MATRSNLILRSVAHPSELNPFALANVAVFFFFDPFTSCSRDLNGNSHDFGSD